MANIPITGSGGNYGLDPWRRTNQTGFSGITGSTVPTTNVNPRITGGQYGTGARMAGSGRNAVTTAVTAGIIPSIDSIKQWTTKTVQGPGAQAFGQTVSETLGRTGKNVGQGLKGAAQATPGIGASALKFIAPNAYQRAITEGAAAYGKSMNAARTLYRGRKGIDGIRGLRGANLINAKNAANIAKIKPGIRIAGGWLGRRAPLIGAGLDLAAGDPLGAAGTLAGGAIGGALTLGNPVGIAVGSMVGGPILKGGRQMLSPIFGDPSNPLSGRDWSIGGIPLTPYARTKSEMIKERDLYKEIQMPLMKEINEAQFEREMKMAKLGMLQNMMSSTNSMMAQAYQAGSY